MSQYAITAYAKRYRLIDTCVVEIAEPAGVTCCGFAWDRSFVVRAAAY